MIKLRPGGYESLECRYHIGNPSHQSRQYHLQVAVSTWITAISDWSGEAKLYLSGKQPGDSSQQHQHQRNAQHRGAPQGHSQAPTTSNLHPLQQQSWASVAAGGCNANFQQSQSHPVRGAPHCQNIQPTPAQSMMQQPGSDLAFASPRPSLPPDVHFVPAVAAAVPVAPQSFVFTSPRSASNSPALQSSQCG